MVQMEKVEEIPRLYTLTLSDDGSPDKDKNYIRIPLSKGKVTLRFILKPGSLAACGTPILSTNYPATGKKFDRSTFQSIKFNRDLNSLVTTCDLELNHPGAYQYQIQYGQDQAQPGYLILEPRLPFPGKPNQQLPLDGIMMLSMVPKWMGPVTQWEPLIRQASDTGYNMIHFVPLQKRGQSNSPYSIRDQLSFDDDLFDSTDLKRSDQEKLKIVERMISKIESDYGLLSLSDVVWNHTSDSSEFLKLHPEAGYNLYNSPYLVPAYELEEGLIELSGRLDELGLPSEIKTEQEIDRLIDHIRHHTLKELKLYEFKVIEVESQLVVFENLLKSPPVVQVYPNLETLSIKERIKLFQSKVVMDGDLGKRFHKTIDPKNALSFVLGLAKQDKVKPDELGRLKEILREVLNQYNLPLYEEYDKECEIALNNIKARLVFTRLAENGPKLGKITKSNPLIETYFTRIEDKSSQHPKGSLILANNGWIWNADPLVDFAGPGSTAYLRRELIVWGDCVKLRYGQRPEDNPWLWSHMKRYTQQIARLFHGIRIDNCHSTPIHVASYFLDAAREIRPDLYVLAELFTGSAEKDKAFVSRLGIHGLIREAMQAWDSHELSRLVHRHGGKPVGSLDEAMVWGSQDGQEIVPILKGSMPRDLFMDCTHDNETPVQKRTGQDTLPNAAVVAFSDCGIGSVKGYDEIYPGLLDLVHETRRYGLEGDGIREAKGRLLRLHQEMCLEGYDEVYVHQENDFLQVHRQRPGDQAGYLLIARMAFPGEGTGRGPIRLRRSRARHLFSYGLKVSGPGKDEGRLVGLQSELRDLKPARWVTGQDQKGEYLEVVLDEFEPGSICVIQTEIGPEYKALNKVISRFDRSLLKDLDLLGCNLVLYRCEAEEREGTGGGVYEIPGHGKLVYAGLEGFMSVLRSIIRDNDLGHPLCDNLRAGLWALDYTIGRLEHYQTSQGGLEGLIGWLRERRDWIGEIPDFLVPKSFAQVIQTAHDQVVRHAISLMSPLIQEGDRFMQQLAMTSVQMVSPLKSASLSPHRAIPSLAAGLPHFSTHHMRTWGRDAFISLRGLLLITGRYKEALDHLVAFAGSLRHGLIPNLLDSVRHPRYNSRDSVWFFLQSLQDYHQMAPDGQRLLKVRVPRRFPKDDRFVEEGYDYSCSMAEVIQEILQRHAEGIHFREHNAGPKIDSQMKEEGFQIDIEPDWSSGVLVGGNVWNCGTWMDKMGESEKAGNKGWPGTPRDGAPIEMTGLLKSTLRWINSLKDEYGWRGVKVDGKEVRFTAWEELLESQFEHVYYIPKEGETGYDVIPEIINRRGIYKDVYRATEPYREYQFRPNVFIAMVVAPELFDRDHAVSCIRLGRDVLLGPLGMRTLDPADLQYRPNYHNSDDSNDFQTAKGRNYHQGPEWVWPLGYFLRAAKTFDALSDQEIARVLRAHRDHIEQSPWAGLPELTNLNGAHCHDSCPTQAWSTATLLDLFYDLIQPQS